MFELRALDLQVRALRLGAATVETVLTRVYRKLGIDSRAELASALSE